MTGGGLYEPDLDITAHRKSVPLKGTHLWRVLANALRSRDRALGGAHALGDLLLGGARPREIVGGPEVESVFGLAARRRHSARRTSAASRYSNPDHRRSP